MEKKVSPSYYASVVVINSDGKVLLGKRREDGIWTSPAGGSEPGEESPAKTAVRELFEEAGLPANEAFLQPILPATPTRNGKLCHTFLYICGSSCQATSKLDPDQEVKTWKWFQMNEIPDALRNDERRFNSVRNAYMKFYGMRKSLIDSLEKGGKPAQVGEIRNFGGTDYQKMADGSWRVHVLKEEKQLEAEQNKNKVVSLTNKLKEKISDKKEISQSEKHLNDLNTQAVVDGKETRSGKPMFTNVDHALAHGYNAVDFREVGSLFYDRAQKMAENIQQLKATKQKVDPYLEKIKNKNLQISRAFVNQANNIEDRKVKKSTVAMSHLDAAEVDTSKFSMEYRNSLESNWLNTFSQRMAEYQYGDSPIEISLDHGNLHLVKVDDGMYSGVFKVLNNTPDGLLEDNAKVRLERMSLPSLVQFCLAKEWIPNVSEPELQTVPEPQPLLPTPDQDTRLVLDRKLDTAINIVNLLNKLVN